MNRCCLTLIIGLSLGGFSHANALYTPCEKTYIDPHLIHLNQHRIEVGNGEEKIQTSTLYSDDSGIYFQDFLKQQEEEQIECFNFEEPIDDFDEVTEEEPLAQESTPPTPLQNTSPKTEHKTLSPTQSSPSKCKSETKFWGKRNRTGLFQ
ncbi:MAG: hypothetical protein KDK64_06290 [Chlamydiia bacterium]|nr:hypothetical protein [Chlamydiia bacterium]